MTDKPKRWTFKEFANDHYDSNYPLNDKHVNAFTANDPLIDWQEQRIKELEERCRMYKEEYFPLAYGASAKSKETISAQTEKLVHLELKIRDVVKDLENITGYLK